MFEALRDAYGELTDAGPPSRSIDVPISFEGDGATSLVVDVAFGAEHDEAVARERARTRDVIDSLSGVSVKVDT
jgi:hypothetical protein